MITKTISVLHTIPREEKKKFTMFYHFSKLKIYFSSLITLREVKNIRFAIGENIMVKYDVITIKNSKIFHLLFK